MNPTQEERVAAARTRMLELKRQFLERSRGELHTLRDSLAALEAGDVGALEVIEQLTHRMSGTGATLGLEALGECAQQVEKLAGTARGAMPDPESMASLRAALEAFAAELARTPPG